MNAGLSNLLRLKEHLLASQLREETKWDQAIANLGLGVAKQFEQHTNRYFYRTTGDTAVFSADRDHVYLPRIPIETITTVELKVDQTTGWETQTSVILNQNEASGLVYFGGSMGDWTALIRVTYTGGYWWDITEDESSSLPTGATALPDDLKLAWLLQCEAVWAVRDKLGVNISTGAGQAPETTLFGLDILPVVKTMLNPFIRYAIT